MSSQRARYLRRATPQLGAYRPCPDCGAPRKVTTVDVSTPWDPHATVQSLAPCPCWRQSVVELRGDVTAEQFAEIQRRWPRWKVRLLSRR